jgi:hypothetical protein
MEDVRSTWTDSRLDDFATNTERRFDDLERRMESGFDRVVGEIREMRKDMNTRFESMENRIDGRFDAMHRTMVHFGASLLASFVGLVVAFVLTQV